jgi:hypothetical protein
MRSAYVEDETLKLKAPSEQDDLFESTFTALRIFWELLRVHEYYDTCTVKKGWRVSFFLEQFLRSMSSTLALLLATCSRATTSTS